MMPDRISQAADVAHHSAWVAGAGTAVGVSTISINEFVALGGLVIALASFGVNWVYRHRLYRLEVERMRSECPKARGKE